MKSTMIELVSEYSETNLEWKWFWKILKQTIKQTLNENGFEIFWKHKLFHSRPDSIETNWIFVGSTLLIKPPNALMRPLELVRPTVELFHSQEGQNYPIGNRNSPQWDPI